MISSSAKEAEAQNLGEEPIEQTTVSSRQVTRMLRAWQAGDRAALDQLTPVVYAELHRIARRHMARERGGHVLQPSALVNEVFVRLSRGVNVDWESRSQFFAVSASLMRQILIGFARTQAAAKRGAGAWPRDVDSILNLESPTPAMRVEEFLAVGQALERLAGLEPRQAKVVELRFFGGLDNTEIAAVMGISEPTVVRDWRFARAWLYSELKPEA